MKRRTQEAKRRTVEAAAASAELAPKQASNRRRVLGAIHSLEENAARADRDGKPATAARRREMAAELRARLD